MNIKTKKILIIFLVALSIALLALALTYKTTSEIPYKQELPTETIEPTNTLLLTNTLLPTATETPVLPTSTATLTASATATATPVHMYHASTTDQQTQFLKGYNVKLNLNGISNQRLTI